MKVTEMRITGISNHGLAAIALLVAILWGCIFAERAIRRQAREQTLILLRSNRLLPTQAPAPVKNRRRPATPLASHLPVPVDLKV